MVSSWTRRGQLFVHTSVEKPLRDKVRAMRNLGCGGKYKNNIERDLHVKGTKLLNIKTKIERLKAARLHNSM